MGMLNFGLGVKSVKIVPGVLEIRAKCGARIYFRIKKAVVEILVLFNYYFFKRMMYNMKREGMMYYMKRERKK
jgi:hypothetical protein